MLLKENTLLKNNYEAKKILCPMGMENQKVNSCPNDCILYKNEFEQLHKCPKYGISRYKVKDDDCNDDKCTKKDPSTKACWYLSIIPRFK